MKCVSYALEVLMTNGNLYFEDYEGKRSPITYCDDSNGMVLFKE